MGCSRQEYWSGLPCPPPEDLPDPGIGPASLMSPELAGRLFTPNATWEAPAYISTLKIHLESHKAQFSLPFFGFQSF